MTEIKHEKLTLFTSDKTMQLYFIKGCSKIIHIFFIDGVFEVSVTDTRNNQILCTKKGMLSMAEVEQFVLSIIE